jgi:hypothetical protein
MASKSTWSSPLKGRPDSGYYDYSSYGGGIGGGIGYDDGYVSSSLFKPLSYGPGPEMKHSRNYDSNSRSLYNKYDIPAPPLSSLSRIGDIGGVKSSGISSYKPSSNIEGHNIMEDPFFPDPHQVKISSDSKVRMNE